MAHAIDGVLSSTLKKLLSSELPHCKSSHLSEAIAAGCGYRTHAAYIADLGESKIVRFIPVTALDAVAMTRRLAAIVTTDAPRAIDFPAALERIGAKVSGDIVPVGDRIRRTPLSTDEVLSHPTGRKAIDGDAVIEAILTRFPNGTPAVRVAEARYLLAAVVGAILWASRHDVYASDIFDLLPLPMLVDLSVATIYGSMDAEIREAILRYQTGLVHYQVAKYYKQPRVTLAHHREVTSLVRRALNGLLDDNALPDPWKRRRDHSVSLWRTFPIQVASVASIGATIRGIVARNRSGNLLQDDITDLLVDAACSVVSNGGIRGIHTTPDFERATHLASLAVMAEQDTAPIEVKTYMRRIDDAGKTRERHATAEHAVHAALGHETVTSLMPHG